MDLRPYLPSTDRVERAAGVLNYQPFMLSDDVQCAFQAIVITDSRRS